MSAETIYTALRNAGMTHAGACGMMGNFAAESSLKSNIVQKGFTSLSDDDFTARVDNDTLDFINGFNGGYGLAQWTYRPRKIKLLAFARNRGTSIGDEQMQVAFAVSELKSDYASLWKMLCSTDDVDTASDRVCDTYERPAVNNYAARRTFARQYDSMFNNKVVGNATPNIAPDLSIWMLQTILNYNCYTCKINGIPDKEFLAKLREFCTDIGA